MTHKHEGTLPPEPVENRTNVGDADPEDYPLPDRARLAPSDRDTKDDDAA